MRWLTLLSLLLLIPWGSTLRAQEDIDDDPFVDTTPAAEPWRKQLDQLTTRLGLTPEQIPAAEAILAEYYSELKANPPATPEAKRARKRTFRSRFQQLLTPEQQAILRNSRNNGGTGNDQRKKRSWLDVLIDDVATPLLDNRKRNRRNGG